MKRGTQYHYIRWDQLMHQRFSFPLRGERCFDYVCRQIVGQGSIFDWGAARSDPCKSTDSLVLFRHISTETCRIAHAEALIKKELLHSFRWTGLPTNWSWQVVSLAFALSACLCRSSFLCAAWTSSSVVQQMARASSLHLATNYKNYEWNCSCYLFPDASPLRNSNHCRKITFFLFTWSVVG